jgi:predicted SnoaL-like aldol condensation-catalyzing enzyme
MKLWVHALCIAGGIATPVALTIWSSSSSGARSDAHYAQIDAAAAAQHAPEADAFSFDASLPVQTDADRASPPGDKSPKAIVNAFDQMGFIDHDPVAALKKYLSDDFIERNPEFAVPGAASDKQAMIDLFSKRGWKPGEGAQDDIYLVIAEGPLVMVYHRVTFKPGTPGIAYADIFKVADGLITEHWAVGQPMPTKNLSKKHSMF